ncbi:hypothetical protein F5B18DRAFT_645468, partial [Nemania serpens]
SPSSRNVIAAARNTCLATTRPHGYGCPAPTSRSFRKAFSSRPPASYVQDAFRSLRTQPPLHIATTLQSFGFPLLTEAHVERWRNRDGTYGAATAAHDDASLSADKTLRQLGRLANTAARGADPACHAEALLVAERQQQALDSSWPQLRHIDRETAG